MDLTSHVGFATTLYADATSPTCGHLRRWTKSVEKALSMPVAMMTIRWDNGSTANTMWRCWVGRRHCYLSTECHVFTYCLQRIHNLHSFFRHSAWQNKPGNAVTCEIRSFQNYFGLPQRPTEIVIFQRVATCLKLFQNYFRSLLQFTNVCQHVQRRWNNSEIISAAEISLFQFQTWLHVKQNTQIISKLFQNNFSSHVTTV